MSRQDETRRAEPMDVRRVATLARLALTDDEAEFFRVQMGGIVDFVRKIGEMDLTGIDPTTHAHPVENVFREDAAVEGLDRASALSNAPKQADGQFVVPKIVE